MGSGLDSADNNNNKNNNNSSNNNDYDNNSRNSITTQKQFPMAVESTEHFASMILRHCSYRREVRYAQNTEVKIAEEEDQVRY